MPLIVYGDINLDELSIALKGALPSKSVRLMEDGEEVLYDENRPNPLMKGNVILQRGTSSSSSSFSSAAAATVPEHKALLEQLEQREKEIKDLEHKAIKSLSTIQALHKQQHTLFDEFVLLRQKYDEQKAMLISTLWITCGQHHPELKSIPQVEDENSFIEQDDQVGNYVVGNVLGEGQFAVVKSCWKADDEEKEFALKIIKKERIATYNSLKRVSNEIEILSKLHSKSVVYIEEVFHTQTKLYMITEKGGRDLFEFFDEHPDGVPDAWAKDIMANILKGVHYCHENFVCHRDLKPENILLEFDSSSGRCLHLKLCDFGLGTVFNPKSLLTDFCGSPGFFAPEMIIHGSYFGDKADIWSVGCILLELVLGHEKFCDAWMVAYDYNILQDKKSFATEIQKVVSKLPQVLNFGPLLNEFITQSLLIRSSDRANTTFLCMHRWLDGLLEFMIESSVDKDGDRLDEKMSDTPTLVRSPSQFSYAGGSLQAHMAGRDEKGSAERSPRSQGQGSRQLQDALKDLYVDVRERRHIAEDHESIHLPPIEPSTPSLSNARKIVNSGDELASKANSGTLLRSPKNKFGDGVSVLPELVEDDGDLETGGDTAASIGEGGGGGGGGESKKVVSIIGGGSRSSTSVAETNDDDEDVFMLQDRKSPRN